MNDVAINQPEVLSAVTAVFWQYERAFLGNDTDTLNHLFWNNQLTVRFGIAEIQYGAEAIYRWRENWLPSFSLARSLRNLVIKTFGDAFATADVEFLRDNEPVGRQSQVWVKFPQGWRVVSAHVSMLETQVV